MASLADPVEETVAYQAVVADVDRAATDAAMASGARPGRDFRPAFWREKKRLLMMAHGIYWRTPAERRASRLRRVGEWTALSLVGAVLGGGLVWLLRTGRVSSGTVQTVLLVVGVPLVAGLIWGTVWLARQPWDEWDEWSRNHDDAP